MDDDKSSLFSVEDDGSLLILSRIGSNESEVDSTVTITPARTSCGGGGASRFSWEETFDDLLELDDDIDDDQQQSKVEEKEPEGIADVSALEIEQILMRERDNLELIRKANDMFRSMIMFSSSKHTTEPASSKRSESMDAAAVNTSNSEISTAASDVTPTTPKTTGKRSLNEKPDLKTETEQQVNVASAESSFVGSKPLISGFSNKLRRRRQPNRPNSNPLNVQAFIQEYYRSLDSVSRYIIAASIFSFLTAFLLLSWYSAQTHSHDMELFALKEKRVLANEEAFTKYQRQTENFRESIIHQRYEESRECQTSLQSCHSKRDELLEQITKIDQDMGKSLIKATAKADSQLKEIQRLNGKIRQLQDENMELRKEIGQSFKSSYAKLILSFLNFAKNRSVQIIFGTSVTVAVLVGLICATFSK